MLPKQICCVAPEQRLVVTHRAGKVLIHEAEENAEGALQQLRLDKGGHNLDCAALRPEACHMNARDALMHAAMRVLRAQNCHTRARMRSAACVSHPPTVYM